MKYKNNFKKPLTLDQQIKYLKEQKRIVFESISEDEAKQVLLHSNYINVISPFKYIFAKKDKEGIPVKDNKNNHIYLRDVDFNEYKTEFEKERQLYPELFRKISFFERTFNAILSYVILINYDIDSLEKFDIFIDDLYKGAASYEGKITARDKMISEISKFSAKLSKYNSPFLFFDRLTLSELVTIYRLIDKDLRKTVFKSLQSINCTIGYPNMQQFDEALTRMIQIRNCIYHNNSLSILVRYYNVREKQFRNDSDKKKYYTLIRHLLEK